MKDDTLNKISRRKILPIFGSVLLIPFIGFGNYRDTSPDKEEKEEDYQILLKKNGTTVKIKSSSIKKARIIKKNISNKSFLGWLGKKF